MPHPLKRCSDSATMLEVVKVIQDEPRYATAVRRIDAIGRHFLPTKKRATVVQTLVRPYGPRRRYRQGRFVCNGREAISSQVQTWIRRRNFGITNPHRLRIRMRR